MERTLSIKVEINWKDPESKLLYQRLKDLGWQAARYRNGIIRRSWAELNNWREAERADDRNGISKQWRKEGKGELSGAAYAAAELEARTIWNRERNRILAGSPLPEWKPTAALSIRGNKKSKGDSGVRLEMENGQYIAYLGAQSKDSPGGCWLRLPIAKHTKRDEWQGEILNQMISWQTPILKATVQVKRNGIMLRLSYRREAPLPVMGERIATLGPLWSNGRLLLRTETQTKDYTSKLAIILTKKDNWDGERRRVMGQIGRRHGHARLKRQRLANLSWDDWLHTHLHTWTREIIDWLATQGVALIRVDSIESGDWPAAKFISLLTYKAEEAGMKVTTEAAAAEEPAAQRAYKAPISEAGRRQKKRREALRELVHQLGGEKA
jgi:hypothetical protein